MSVQGALRACPPRQGSHVFQETTWSVFNSGDTLDGHSAYLADWTTAIEFVAFSSFDGRLLGFMWNCLRPNPKCSVQDLQQCLLSTQKSQAVGINLIMPGLERNLIWLKKSRM